jgi:hypothetical protein
MKLVSVEFVENRIDYTTKRKLWSKDYHAIGAVLKINKYGNAISKSIVFVINAKRIACSKRDG